MSITPSDFVGEVRTELGDIGTDYLSNEATIQVLEQSWALIQKFIDDVDEVDETLAGYALVAMGAFYAYQVYAGMAERLLGNVPEDYNERLLDLKSKALAFLRLVADVPVTDEFEIKVAEDKGVAYLDLTGSVLDG